MSTNMPQIKIVRDVYIISQFDRSQNLLFVKSIFIGYRQHCQDLLGKLIGKDRSCDSAPSCHLRQQPYSLSDWLFHVIYPSLINLL
jgi:hypothetical protein